MTGSLIDATQFKALMYLREHWMVMRDECIKLDRNDVLPNADRMNRTHEEVGRLLKEGGRPRWIKSWGEQKSRWLNWGIVLQDECVLGDAGVPQTAALLRKVKGLRVAALSLFRGSLMLATHAHPELAREQIYTFHLGLECPPNCYLNADGQFAREDNGKAIVFDGSRPHYAFNATDADRLILYCEFSPTRLPS